MHNKASLGLSLAVMALSAWGIVSAWGWPAKAALFPLVISIPLFLLAAAELVWVLVGSKSESAADFKLSDHLPQDVALRRTALAAGWIFAFLAAIVLLGFGIAVPLFVLAYLRLQGKAGWVFSVALAAGVWVFFFGLFDLLLHLPFPTGLVRAWVGLG